MLNLMRSLTGTGWGARQTALLAIYRALIRSLLAYGAEALDSASPSVLAALDAIQGRALRICCGAMTGTPLQALQNECGEVSLGHRRRRQQLRYSVRVQSTPDHPAGDILKDHWTNHYGKTQNSIYNKMHDFINDNQIHLTNSTDPPWSRDPFCMDSSLTEVLKKSDPENNCKALALELISRYPHQLNIYTDGSKDQDGQVACSV